MTWQINKNQCNRCTRVAFCIEHELGTYCENCFVTIHNDPSEKQTIDRVYQSFDKKQIEKIKKHEWDLDDLG